MLALVCATAGNEISTNRDPKSIQRMMRAYRKRVVDIMATAELTLMHTGKCEMSCFLVPLAQIGQTKKPEKTVPLLWNTALFLAVASKGWSAFVRD